MGTAKFIGFFTRYESGSNKRARAVIATSMTLVAIVIKFRASVYLLSLYTLALNL